MHRIRFFWCSVGCQAQAAPQDAGPEPAGSHGRRGPAQVACCCLLLDTEIDGLLQGPHRPQLLCCPAALSAAWAAFKRVGRHTRLRIL